MTWLDCWLAIPWLLYDFVALRVLAGTALGVLVIAYSSAARAFIRE